MLQVAMFARRSGGAEVGQGRREVVRPRIAFLQVLAMRTPADAIWLTAHVDMGPTSVPIHLQGL
jgi:hypothetical protein